MPIDLSLIGPDGNKEIVIESQKKRFAKEDYVSECEEIYKTWKKARGDLDTLNMVKGQIQKKITERKKADKTDKCEDLTEEKSANDQKIVDAEKHMESLWGDLEKKYSKVGNLVHESVPISDNEEHNKVEKTWGTPNKMVIDGKPGSAHHHEVLKFIGGFDPERGNKVAGHRGYFLKGYGVLLNQALIQYGIQFLSKFSYTPVQTPYFMKHSVMTETCQLSDFDENLYKIVNSNNPDEEPKYLIATSEQPISGMYRKEWLEPKELPLRFGGISTCFRKEAGSAGKDMWGIFRVHQFEKIEQFCITTPEESWKMHEEMIECAEKFYQSLELPYQVINIVSGALNDAAAKKYDLEAWFPGYGAYRELVSCSNCTDYQSRSLDIRLRTNLKDKKDYVHMLNATLCATERTLCCILENYQTPEGVKVPTVLQPFVGTDFIPYIKELLPGQEVKKEKKEKKEKTDKTEKTVEEQK